MRDRERDNRRLANKERPIRMKRDKPCSVERPIERGIGERNFRNEPRSKKPNFIPKELRSRQNNHSENQSTNQSFETFNKNLKVVNNNILKFSNNLYKSIEHTNTKLSELETINNNIKVLYNKLIEMEKQFKEFKQDINKTLDKKISSISTSKHYITDDTNKNGSISPLAMAKQQDLQYKEMFETFNTTVADDNQLNENVKPNNSFVDVEGGLDGNSVLDDPRFKKMFSK